MPTENKLADPFAPDGRTLLTHLRVRGALHDFSKRQLKGMFRLEDSQSAPQNGPRITCSKRWPETKNYFCSDRSV